MAMPKQKERRPSTTHAILNHIEFLIELSSRHAGNPEELDWWEKNSKLKRWIYLMRKRLRFQSQLRRHYVKLKQKESK